MKEFYEEIFCDLFDCGVMDLEKFIKLYKLCEKFGITMDEVKDFMNEVGIKCNLNGFIYAMLSLLNDKIFSREIPRYIRENGTLTSQLKDTLNELCDFYIDEFNPIVNYMDSWFNNCLDEFIWNTDDLTRRDIIEKAIYYMINHDIEKCSICNKFYPYYKVSSIHGRNVCVYCEEGVENES